MRTMGVGVAGTEEEAGLEGDEEEGACSLPRAGGGEISQGSDRCAGGEDSDKDDAGVDGFDGFDGVA